MISLLKRRRRYEEVRYGLNESNRPRAPILGDKRRGLRNEHGKKCVSCDEEKHRGVYHIGIAEYSLFGVIPLYSSEQFVTYECAECKHKHHPEKYPKPKCSKNDSTWPDMGIMIKEAFDEFDENGVMVTSGKVEVQKLFPSEAIEMDTTPPPQAISHWSSMQTKRYHRLKRLHQDSSPH
jgi:hypothetical protein